MDKTTLPLLPTSVVGSHALPGWLHSMVGEIDSGKYGETDIKETYDDAVDLAILDQERAGIDVITDGEMRRSFFVQGFYKMISGIEPDPLLRTVGPSGYDSPRRFHTVSKIQVPDGLGIVEEFTHIQKITSKPIKATCPGPLTISMHIRPQTVYKSRLDMAWEFSDIINSELKALVDAGANFIQIDEPSFAIVPGELNEWVSLYNACVKDIDAKLALHICFGNLDSRPRGKREYAWMWPLLNDMRADQLVLEFANREFVDVDLWKSVSESRELGAGVIDVKSFYVETPTDVATRIKRLLEFVPAEKLWINPDCGFFAVPRWLAIKKLNAMAAGTQLVRTELTKEK
ncbi:MAG: methionine synthase [Dehalococcoidia bacterium]|nr:methionine synthase [Dehalococcoidia bacterium]